MRKSPSIAGVLSTLENMVNICQLISQMISTHTLITSSYEFYGIIIIQNDIPKISMEFSDNGRCLHGNVFCIICNLNLCKIEWLRSWQMCWTRWYLNGLTASAVDGTKFTIMLLWPTITFEFGPSPLQDQPHNLNVPQCSWMLIYKLRNLRHPTSMVNSNNWVHGQFTI